ncbi:MAG TPA: 2-phospho-L-lactate transferase CofD family protein [Polyangiaceae bacterium]|jgi:2-phospho-L-lactate transferase/gluconeogenesis factor (CofD/UPF0052 family)
MTAVRKLVVSMFSGGRGTASITRELVRHANIDLHLLINAYDDGLSTGELRSFIPGMLGPSDFRKNLSYLLDLYSLDQFALEKFIEYRLPRDFTSEHLRELQAVASDPNYRTNSLPFLRETLYAMDPPLREPLAEYLRIFFQFFSTQGRPFNFVDCSVGNLVFAGAYLKNGNDFNKATSELETLFGAKASLINVTRGENRILVALKEDGEVLEREARIVSAQSTSRIADLFLLEHPLDAATVKALEGLPLEKKRERLAALDARVELSPEARDAILSSDIVIYGPGTQYSSIFPSYKTSGLSEALRSSRAYVKALIVNLDRDHDIQSLSATDIVDMALHFLGDPENRGRLVTHILYSERRSPGPSSVGLDEAKVAGGTYKGAAFVRGDFENPVKTGVHSGLGLVRAVRDLYESERHSGRGELDIYIDLNRRSVGLTLLMQEFLELPWNESFSNVRLTLNQMDPPQQQLPTYLQMRRSDRDDSFSDTHVFIDWLKTGGSEYLVTISGDGEYRLSDVLAYVDLIKRSPFGAVFGSRNQSRRQFMKSLNAAYGESALLYYVSWLGALALSGAFGARHQVIFSDPLTGFRIYKRSILVDALGTNIDKLHASGAMAVTRQLVDAGVEIAEVPVAYRTFKGFTNVGWRFWRGVKNAWSAF